MRRRSITVGTDSSSLRGNAMSDASHAQPKFLTDLFGWYSMTMLGLGARTGLLDALQQGPGTAADASPS
jgi:hypothetical protein